MSIGSKLSIALLTVALAAPITLVLAQDSSRGMQSQQDGGMSMGRMGQGMMGGGMMSGRMMAGGCAGMMQSMNNGGDGRPNSEWQKPSSRSPDHGG